MLKRLSLRTRLVLGVLAVATVGLVVADVATYTSLRSFLFDRVDKTLDDDHRAVEGYLHAAASSPDDLTSLPVLAPGLYAQIRSTTGHVLGTFPRRGFPGHAALSPPTLPATIQLPAQAQSGHGPDRAR